MDFELFKQINDERWNYREMESATVVSSYRNTGCGDGYRIYLKIDETDRQKRVLDASYTTTGCGFGLVSLAMATEWAKGRPLAELEKVTAEDIERQFEFPPRRKNYPASAAECLRKAIADYKNGTGIHPEDQISGQMVMEKLRKQGHLRRESLRQVILEGESLEQVDFSEADLSHAFLTSCNFSGANFRRARLRGAFLNNANLRGADLRQADLRWAKLTGADLENARLEGAYYDVGTRFDPRYIHLFGVMEKSMGRDIYLQKRSEKMSKEIPQEITQ